MTIECFNDLMGLINRVCPMLMVDLVSAVQVTCQKPSYADSNVVRVVSEIRTLINKL